MATNIGQDNLPQTKKRDQGNQRHVERNPRPKPFSEDEEKTIQGKEKTGLSEE